MKKKNLLALAGSGGLMGAYIFVGSFGGDYLDSSLNNNKPIFTIIGALLGVFLGLYQLFKSIKKFSNEK
ncbi:MAG: hypothetical protein CMD01_01215 [Flavobacteriales bacterium]|nr:hypothetical protein [Flavobacteriales bacterium]|tara:strand:- start:1491 stop:1697 length:207 start_codon:yes stop_codon:yes gene_type:complete